MPTGTACPPESSILGESWVLASSSSLLKKDIPGKSCRKDGSNEEDDHKGCESMTTSASSVSGPELIMPSIYEVSVSEASWVAPEMRSRRSTTLKRRHKRASTSMKQDAKQPSIEDSTTRKPKNAERESSRTAAVSTRIERYFRALINLLLMAAISHLLILPELVTQYQTLCSIDVLSTLYPSSCIPPYPQPQPTTPSPSRHDAIHTSQTRLETLFNTTHHQMIPLHASLQQTESLLRALQTELKTVYPGAKHELDLEFHGCGQAARAAAGKFASLKADIQSAVDSLLASSASLGGTGGGGTRSVARDARLSTQLARREQYLDQLTARMQSKAEALSNDFAALDDHLESIQRIVEREMSASASVPAGSPENNDNRRAGLWAFVDVVVPSLRFSVAEDKSPADTHVSESLRLAVAHHRPVADVIRRLYHDLQNLQSRKGRAA